MALIKYSTSFWKQPKANATKTLALYIYSKGLILKFLFLNFQKTNEKQKSEAKPQTEEKKREW